MGVGIRMHINRNIPVVINYSALPAVGVSTGEYYWAETSQGTAWLPGSLGGTYYPKGLYYSNGVTWNHMESPAQATQVEVNTGTNTDKFVTPETFTNSTQLSNKLDINALPSNLTLYPTSTASDIGGYYKMVSSLDDPDYDSIAVDFATPLITSTGQLVGSVATTAGVLSGNPGVLPNVGTIGNIKRNSGSGTATFYFEIYHRDSGGTETLIGTSNVTDVVSSSGYIEFEAFVVWDNGVFVPTDRIVIKYYANRIAGGSNPVYSFQFGGTAPVRTVVPVPASVLLNAPIQVGTTKIINGTNGKTLYNNNGVVGEIGTFKWTVDGMDTQTGNIYPNLSCAIASITNIVNSPTTTITINGSAYTLGDPIVSGDEIGVSLSAAGVIDLNFTF